MRYEGSVMFVVCCAGSCWVSPASADIVYVSQERFVEAAVTRGERNRQSASNFSPFDATVIAVNPNGIGGRATQSSVLGLTTIRGVGEGSGNGSRVDLIFGNGTSSMLVTFDVMATTEFRMEGFMTRDVTASLDPMARTSMNGPNGVVFDLRLENLGPDRVFFQGANAIRGELVPGRYTFNAFALGSSVRQGQSATFDISLSIPSPIVGSTLALGLLARSLRQRSP